MKPFKALIVQWAMILIVGMASGCSPPPPTQSLDIAQALSSDEDSACYDRAKKSETINLPSDHGPHNGFKTEWWYYTGNLKSGSGRHFGYQLTFFRQALACRTAPGPSKWRTNQFYFAHFAVTDTQNQQFYSAHRMNRQSVGIAGASRSPFRVWIDAWSAKDIKGPDHARPGSIQLTARDQEMAIDLTLVPEKAVIFQGDQGLSRKGPGPFDASHYYSIPVLITQGKLEIGNESFEVLGKTWFDHEWSTSALGDDAGGWDWFAIHLDDGRDLMVCQVRKKDNSPNEYGFGSISFADGTYEILGQSDFSIQAVQLWKSPKTGRQYPARWKILVPDHTIDLEVSPVMDGQEHSHMFVYYEGAVRVTGPVTGLGYVEMTGY
ncbi:MAG: carotenoid 1,2-hydratase [Proteobacteria bacterium]|nr:carotenoid 1,2-hydratase [Desulfobacula sp.]MBU3953278.1 carotenoid 1,2-hydratase [Pseudomonadota bacterium]MBU4132649.1 carotenoid 1,2-hydratase [Pseudomonadota bacterium]